jgi:hypothetical protein
MDRGKVWFYLLLTWSPICRPRNVDSLTALEDFSLGLDFAAGGICESVIPVLRLKSIV